MLTVPQGGSNLLRFEYPSVFSYNLSLRQGSGKYSMVLGILEHSKGCERTAGCCMTSSLAGNKIIQLRDAGWLVL